MRQSSNVQSQIYSCVDNLCFQNPVFSAVGLGLRNRSFLRGVAIVLSFTSNRDKHLFGVVSLMCPQLLSLFRQSVFLHFTWWPSFLLSHTIQMHFFLKELFPFISGKLSEGR